jgi:hypothetical protein
MGRTGGALAGRSPSSFQPAVVVGTAVILSPGRVGLKAFHLYLFVQRWRALGTQGRVLD